MLDVLIVGAGPSGLKAAEELSLTGYSVTIIDRMPSPARKFLMAGRGGLNLTHSEEEAAFLSRYRQANSFLAPIIEEYSPKRLIEWCHDLGQETFVGTSGRVFPKVMKASPLLRAWLRRLEAQGVKLRTRQDFCGFSEDGMALVKAEDSAPTPIQARSILLALGGASWPKLGSNAAWVESMRDHGITINEFQPANCGFLASWSDVLKERFSGHPLKGIELSVGSRTVNGEAIVSERGLEGGVVYTLSAEIRDSIKLAGKAEVRIDLRPSHSSDDLVLKLSRPRGKLSMATYLKKILKFKPVEYALIREAGPIPNDPEDLAARIKSVAVTCHAPYPIDRAISSAGGISLDEVTETLMLKKIPGVFIAGEMLDWEAPTGGYLLQACIAMGHCAAKGIAAYLDTDNTGDNLG
ncbi:MAG: TIGR03862 family flavoprotein [Roseibium sp.]